jgi:hypothetical protein
MKTEKENKSKIDQVEEMKIWEITRIYNSGRISGATNKGIAIKAHYLGTPGACQKVPSIDVVKIRDDIVYRHCNLYWTRPDPRDLATYINGPGEAGQGQIEIELIEYYAYS